MKMTALIREIIRYQIKYILFGKFQKEIKTPLEISFNQREAAYNITHKWALCSGMGISMLVFIFVVFRYISSVPLLIISGLLLIGLTYVFSSLISCIYLFIALMIKQKEDRRAKTGRYNSNIDNNPKGN